MNSSTVTMILILALVLGVLFLAGIMLRSNEDDWIKNKTGLYEKHGVPSETPQEVVKQKSAVDKASELYETRKNGGMVFNSQCLGVVGEGGERYAVDIVHVPRTSEDNLEENQCEAYRTGEVKRFIELDKDGELVRVVD